MLLRFTAAAYVQIDRYIPSIELSLAVVSPAKFIASNS